MWPSTFLPRLRRYRADISNIVTDLRRKAGLHYCGVKEHTRGFYVLRLVGSKWCSPGFDRMTVKFTFSGSRFTLEIFVFVLLSAGPLRWRLHILAWTGKRIDGRWMRFLTTINLNLRSRPNYCENSFGYFNLWEYSFHSLMQMHTISLCFLTGEFFAKHLHQVSRYYCF